MRIVDTGPRRNNSASSEILRLLGLVKLTLVERFKLSTSPSVYQIGSSVTEGPKREKVLTLSALSGEKKKVVKPSDEMKLNQQILSANTF